MATVDLKADGVRWDLSCMYSGVDDPQIDRDMADYVAFAKKFNADYKGKLHDRLGAAIADCAMLEMLSHKIGIHMFLRQSLNVAEARCKAKIAELDRIFSHTDGEYMTFFGLEIKDIPEDILAKLYASDPVVLRHKPWIEHIRLFKPFSLSEEVEVALAKRSSFGPGAWGEFFEECESDLRFLWNGAEKTLPEMLDILTNDPQSSERAMALKAINDGLGGYFAKYSAQHLYQVAGKCAVERKERGYKHPMEARNKSNQIPDAVVDALHAAVVNVSGPLLRRYFKLKAEMLGVPVLRWSDRNAPLPFSDTAQIPFDEAMTTVLSAYESFSPTLAGIIRTMAAQKRIDAPALTGKRGGAFNYSFSLPGEKPVSFTFLNYLGSSTDVMTLAHELGHGVHGILAGEAQGTLMAGAPTAYAETASTFGEAITSDFLKKNMQERGETAALISFIAKRIDEQLGTCDRQICFSNFERQVHGMSADYSSWGEVQKRSVEELDELWLRTTMELYGSEGEVFTYADMSHMWAYIHHFHTHDPFYVYGYAFGILLVQSLYAKRAELGARFEPLYLDLLRSGGTKDVIMLTKPFGLDPTHESFWADGIRGSLGAMIDELEALYRGTKKQL